MIHVSILANHRHEIDEFQKATGVKFQKIRQMPNRMWSGSIGIFRPDAVQPAAAPTPAPAVPPPSGIPDHWVGWTSPCLHAVTVVE